MCTLNCVPQHYESQFAFAIPEDNTRAVDMVRQLRRQEISQLKDSLRRRGTRGTLRKMATMDASQLAQAKAKRAESNEKGENPSLVRSETQVPMMAALARENNTREQKADGYGRQEETNGEKEKATEEKMVKLADAGVKGKVEDGEGDSDEEDIDTLPGAEKEEDDMDGNSLQYVQKFLFCRKDSETHISLTKRLQKYARRLSRGGYLQLSCLSHNVPPDPAVWHQTYPPCCKEEAPSFL